MTVSDGQNGEPNTGDKGGDPVTNDCELCHYVLAVDEPDPEVFRCLTVVRSVSLFGGGEDP